jgi:hypothetical protein
VRESSDSERIAKDYFHGEIASVQWIVRILMLTSDRACGVAAKQGASVQ